MVEPEKPFACTMPECGMTFTNEDHLHVHTKKHDMVLQFGMEQKAAFVADQTPTPTRFIRNCEEVGLFQDLQNVNPFDEGFKRAMETKHGILSLENAIAASASDDLHTPQMMFPLIDSGDSSLYSTTNNQRNITISRSSSDESGAIKEFETTTISKLTNEVTTISRIIGKQDDAPKTDDTRHKEGIRTDSVSYRNNVIIHSNVEIRKDIEKPLQTLVSYEDTVIKEGNVINRDTFDTSKLQVPDAPPIMSQKSIDLVVESLTSDICKDKADIPHKEPSKANKSSEDNSYEVIIKLPNGKKVIMKSAEEINETKNTTQNTKEMLKKVLTEKVEHKNQLQKMNTLPNILQTAIPIPTCTFVPVSIVSQNHIVPKIAIPPFKIDKTFDKKPVKRKNFATDVRQCKNINRRENNNKISGELNKNVEENSKKCKTKVEVGNVNENCVIINGFERGHNKNQIKTNYVTKNDLESRSAASRRYRARLKEAWVKQAQEMRQLRETNERLTADKAILKTIIMEHMKRCPNAEDLRLIQEKLCQNGTNI